MEILFKKKKNPADSLKPCASKIYEMYCMTTAVT